MERAVTPTMRADTRALAGTETDVAPLLGTWVNAKRDSENVGKAVLAERNGTVSVRLYGVADDLVDWGETEAVPYVFTGTSEVAGFHARYELNGTRTEIAANVKLGILVIQTYTTFADDRLSQFSREFFFRSEERLPATLPGTGRDFLPGDWVNTNADTKWFKGFTLTDTGEAVTLHVQAAGEPTDWGEVEVATYLDGSGEPAFHARYDLDSVDAVLAGNTGKSIIIIAAYLRFKADETANTFWREFFVPR